MKHVLITGGPTGEPIDEIMRVITFSTGSLSVNLAKNFLDNGYSVTLVIHHSVDTNAIDGRAELTIKRVESTDEMMATIEECSKEKEYNALLHTSAVGDYKSDFTFLMEDMAKEIYEAVQSGKVDNDSDILNIMENPSCKLDDSSKISSYEKNLTVKLGLTPKIISNLREWFPDTLLIGCKLLDKVSQEELFEVAQALCKKNDMDFIMANDLAELNKGNKTRYIINQNGYTGTGLDTPEEIFDFVNSNLNS